MRAPRGFALLFAVFIAACGDDPAPIEPTPDANVTTPDAPPTAVQLRDWVGTMTSSSADDAVADTVEDKVGIVVDTDDPAAFDDLLVEP
jgi:hypothetical protein